MRRNHRAFFVCLLGLVLANYLAQIPYYLDVYYFPHHAAPNIRGSLLLLATLVWFLTGYLWLARGSRIGYWVLLSFLVVEVGFYLYNTVGAVAHGYAPFFHLQARDPVLFVVFGIGYLNLIAGLYFLYYLVRHRKALLALGAPALAHAGR